MTKSDIDCGEEDYHNSATLNEASFEKVSLTDQSTIVSTAISQNALVPDETQKSTSLKQNELPVSPEILKPPDELMAKETVKEIFVNAMIFLNTPNGIMKAASNDPIRELLKVSIV